jgi:hypothetical protein
MIHPTRILLTAAFSLLSVLTAQASSITITSLPFTITKAGTYLLASDFTFTDPTRPAIYINGFQVTGPVVLNFNGHTLTGPGAPVQDPLSGYVESTPNYNIGIAAVGDKGNDIPVTIENGTIQGFGLAIQDQAKFVYRYLIVKNMKVFGRI